MNALPLTLALFLLPNVLLAQAKPIAYDHESPKDIHSPGNDIIDKTVNAALADKYQIQPLQDSPDYSAPQAVSGSLPDTAKSTTGEKLSGYLMVGYVVSTAGLADDPVVLKTTDPRLNQTALSAMAGWHFKPAKLKGVPISTTAAQDFYFKDDSKPRGYELGSIALYQSNDSLEKRATAEAIADYIKKIEAAASDVLANDPIPESLQVIFVTWPDKKVRIWFISSRDADDGHLEALRASLLEVDPIIVTGGPLAFDMDSKIAGGDGKGPQIQENGPPIPAEWKEIARKAKTTLPIDQLLDALPKDAVATAPGSPSPVPTPTSPAAGK